MSALKMFFFFLLLLPLKNRVKTSGKWDWKERSKTEARGSVNYVVVIMKLLSIKFLQKMERVLMRSFRFAENANQNWNCLRGMTAITGDV